MEATLTAEVGIPAQDGIIVFTSQIEPWIRVAHRIGTAIELTCSSYISLLHAAPSPYLLLLQTLHHPPPQLMARSAYRGPYGNPLIPDPEAMAGITPDTLRAFTARTYIAPHMVLAAAGVEHK